MWDPWVGCSAASEGCLNCFYYGQNAKRHGTPVTRTDSFYKLLDKKKNGVYKVASGREIATCFASDFFHPDADEWRREAWGIMKERSDLRFMLLTKRIERFEIGLPEDWGDGYENVFIGCTCESQEMAEKRLPLFLSFPIKRRFIACSPILTEIDLSPWLSTGKIETVSVGGELAREARPCQYEWVMNIRDACAQNDVKFWFKSTGSRFVKDGQLYKIAPNMQHRQAREAGINIE